MISLSTVFSFIGYKEQAQQLAYVKLLAFKNCFHKPIISEALSKQQIERASIVSTIWEKTDLKTIPYLPPSQVISDALASLLLKINFSSLAEGFSWLHQVTEIYFLRQSFDHEGTGKENLGLNTAQWCFNDEIAVEICQNQQTETSKLYECFKALNLITELPWPNDQEFQQIIFLSSLEKHVKERVEFLQPFSGTLYFVSGARGLFNHEPSLAPLLAEWFNLPEKSEAIQNVLNRHKSFQDPMNWTGNLSALKQEILSAIGEDHWCDAHEKSWYYTAPEVYEKNCRKKGFESLKNWPVAMDMFNYHFKQRNFKTVNLVHLPIKDKAGRLPTTKDFITAWYKHYGHKILEKQNPIFIACNGTHRLPLVIQNVMHTLQLQQDWTKQSMRHHLNKFKKNELIEDAVVPVEKFKPLVIGPSAKHFSLNRGLDVLARSLYPLTSNLQKEIRNFEEIVLTREALNEAEKKKNIPVYLVKQILIFHQYSDLVSLANSALNLAFSFYLIGDFIKTAGLFNFVLNLLREQGNNDSLSTLLYQCTLVNMQNFIAQSVKKLAGNAPDFERLKLEEEDKNNQFQLAEVRKKIKDEFNQIKTIERKPILDLYKKCFLSMQTFFIHLIDQTKFYYGAQSPELFFAYLGSHARKQSTPWSDVEFFILTNGEHESYYYSKALTKLLLLKVLNLNETVLRALGISVYDHQGVEFKLNDPGFDLYSTRGFSFDFNDFLNASKTPLGGKQWKLSYRLIGSPEELAQFGANLGAKFCLHFPQLMRSSSDITGSQTLYLRYQAALVQDDFDFFNYCLLSLKKDIGKFLIYLNELETLEVIHNKNYFFRPLHLLVDDLYLAFFPFKSLNFFQETKSLCKNSIINEAQRKILEKTMLWVLYFRMKETLSNQGNRFQINLRENAELKMLLQELRAIYINIKEQLENTESPLIKQLHAVAEKAQLKQQNKIAEQIRFFKLSTPSPATHTRPCGYPL